MPALNILVDFLPKVLFYHRDLAEPVFGIAIGLLEVGEEIGEERSGVVFAVADEEGEIDEVVRVGEVLEVGEEHGQMWCGVSEGCAEEDAFFALPTATCAAYVAEVVVAHCFYVEFFTRWEEGFQDCCRP